MTKTYLDTGVLSHCCGCAVCADVCSQNAISMVTGYDQGKYPVIDIEKCIHCNACRKVCPMSSLPEMDAKFPVKAYVFVLNNEEQRLESASGGAFEGIAAALESHNPDLMIAGAMWDKELKVRHELLPAAQRAVFKKSKYIQSDCVAVYRKVKKALVDGRTVLFTGTPCQVAGLKKYLGKQYEKLITVDIVCHGAPGAGVFQKYIKEIEEKQHSKVISSQFRVKKKDIFGEVHSDYIELQLENGEKIHGNKKTNEYLSGFHTGLFYRESCYSCHYANPQRYSDITIGDYWHIQKLFPDLVDYSGVSCVMVNSQKGYEVISSCTDFRLQETSVEFLLNHNGQLKSPSKKPKNREAFFDALNSKPFDLLIHEYVGKPKYFENAVSSFIPGKLKRMIKKGKE